jgi:hypothetical protein
MCDGLNRVVSALTAKEGGKGPSAASVHIPDKESDKGSSAGKESAKGSSPANLASSGIYSEKSAMSGEDKWEDLPDEDTSKEDAKGLSLNEDDWVTTKRMRTRTKLRQTLPKREKGEATPL